MTKTVTPKAPYAIEQRVLTESGWRLHRPAHEYGDRDLALAAFDAQYRLMPDVYGWSGEWRLVLVGPDHCVLPGGVS